MQVPASTRGFTVSLQIAGHQSYHSSLSGNNDLLRSKPVSYIRHTDVAERHMVQPGYKLDVSIRISACDKTRMMCLLVGKTIC